MMSEETRHRELAPLAMVRDNYEKLIITMDKPIVADIDGIKIINATEWLLSE
ncbi:MAG: hypothetical protein Q4D76_06130 [Oscillospiraceae bacterium]|nr:hypothetical protein [Oscillospiraceae bacterium]